MVTDLIALRHKYDDLHGNGELEFLWRENEIPFAFRRGSLMMFFNPMDRDAEIVTDWDGDVVYKIGDAVITDGKARMKPQSFLLIRNA